MARWIRVQDEYIWIVQVFNAKHDEFIQYERNLTGTVISKEVYKSNKQIKIYKKR